MRRLTFLILLCCSLARGADDRPARRLKDKRLEQRINAAIEKGATYLQRVQNKQGSWPYDARRGAGFQQHATGGLTALALYALAASRVPEENAALRAGVRWVQQHPEPFGPQGTFGTYSASLLILALTRINERRHRARIHELAGRLIESQTGSDSWTYRLAPGLYGGRGARGRMGVGGDNSNAQFAILALWAAYSLTDYKVPARTWRRIADAYQRSQLPRGGWAYTNLPPNAKVRKRAGRGQGRPSMTAAGLVAYVYARAALDGSPQALRAARRSKTAQRGRKALLQGTPNYLDYYFAYALERAGTVMDLPLKDWYVPGARALLGVQKRDGSWRSKGGHRGDSQSVYTTSLALLFLTRTTLPPRRAAITKRETFPDLAQPGQLTRGFDFYLAYKPQKRAEVLYEFAKAGRAAIGFFIHKLEDPHENVRVTAHELLTRLLAKRFFYEPKWPEEDRRVMMGPIAEFWKRHQDAIAWNRDKKRFVVTR